MGLYQCHSKNDTILVIYKKNKKLQADGGSVELKNHSFINICDIILGINLPF